MTGLFGTLPWHTWFSSEIGDNLNPNGNCHPDMVRYSVTQVCDYDGECVCWAKSLEHAMFIVNAVNHLHRARLEGTWPPTLGTEFPRWRDVADEPPQKAQEVLFVHGGKTVHGAWIGGAFWHNNQRCSATTWLPLPTPPKYDVSGTGRHSEK